MVDRPLTGLYEPRARQEVVADLVARARSRLEAASDERLIGALEDALYHERRRLEDNPGTEEELARLDALARAVVKGGRTDRVDAALSLVSAWTQEIHGHFSMRAYRFASTVFPPALAALLTARPERLSEWELRAEQRLQVDGDLPLLRQLSKEATLILAPTHLSNLDSPLIGLALTLADLPPFQYGAGLNLFSNPVLGWWMRRLGAYTVDRTKKAELYKQVLKDYSVYQLQHRHHSLFFPGGTRSRSGAIETRLKKGLLGTGVLAWQEMLAAGRPDADVYVVPMTISYQLTLEANTLIDDHLADAGRQRYIITDDEFAQPRRIATFLRRVLSLDSAAVVRFGQPLDLLGFPVPEDVGARRAASRRRRGFVCNRHGEVEWDAQRDRVYTERLANALIEAWPRNATVMTTHLGAWVGIHLLSKAVGTSDPFRLVRTAPERRRIPRQAFLATLDRAAAQIRQGAAEGRWHHALPDDPVHLLDNALEAFSRYHRSRALVARGEHIVVEDPRLALYYSNRCLFAGLEP
jgi:glycerol-3-phosphate O-acyltransferase